MIENHNLCAHEIFSFLQKFFSHFLNEVEPFVRGVDVLLQGSDIVADLNFIGVVSLN